jgi:hypothetical protein
VGVRMLNGYQQMSVVDVLHQLRRFIGNMVNE